MLTDALLRRGDGGAPAPKRSKRADLLAEMGDFGGESRQPKGSSSQTSSTSKKAADLEAMKAWLTEDDAATPEPVSGSTSVASAEPSSSSDSASSAVGRPAAAGSASSAVGHSSTASAWRELFALAKDRWDVDEETSEARYHDTKRDLYFDWEQHVGTLFQYFPDDKDASGRPARAPIWSVSCPETHAEVWDVLPLPPTDAAASVGEEEPAAATDAAGASSAAAAAEAAASAPAETTSSSMAPPAMPPPMMAPKKKQATAAASADAVEAKTEADDDSDDEAVQVGEALLAGSTTVLGCAMPPPDVVAAARAPIAIAEDPPKRPISVDDREDLDPSVSARPPCLDSDDEADLPGSKEDIRLPAAPAEVVEPTATDLDLDMFG